MEEDIAPSCCIVCRKEHPGTRGAPGWTYLAGVSPIGAMTCSDTCTKKAAERFRKHGRVDVKEN